MPQKTLEIHDHKDSDDAKMILRNLISFNEMKARSDDSQELMITLKSEKGELVAGLNGHTGWGWLFVQTLWVSDDSRRGGMGTLLMAAAESEAKRRGCAHAWLDTFSFQAREFYEKLGYAVFGQLEDFPEGHRRFFLQKKLS